MSTTQQLQRQSIRQATVGIFTESDVFPSFLLGAPTWPRMFYAYISFEKRGLQTSYK